MGNASILIKTQVLLFNTGLSLSSLQFVECHYCHWRAITSRLFAFCVLWQWRKMKNKTGKTKLRACCCTPLCGWKLLSILLMWPHLVLSCPSRWVSGELSCLWWRDFKKGNEWNELAGSRARGVNCPVWFSLGLRSKQSSPFSRCYNAVGFFSIWWNRMAVLQYHPCNILVFFVFLERGIPPCCSC